MTQRHRRWIGPLSATVVLLGARPGAAEDPFGFGVATRGQYAGWTADSRHFLWELDLGSGSWTERRIYDARTGTITASPSDESCGSKGKSDTDRFYCRTIEQVKGAFSETSPDGKARAEVVPILTGGAGEWQGDGIWYRHASIRMELRVVRDGASRLSAAVEGSVAKVRPYWSPDGSMVAWSVERPDGALDMVFGTAGIVNVDVVGEKLVLAKAQPALDAIAAAGFKPTGIRPALKPRDVSVVYYAADLKDAAERIAKVLPGGATVEKIDWKTPAEIVVALGRSVLRVTQPGK